MAEQALQSPAPTRTAPESQLTIEVQNLHKVYQLGEIRVPALRGVSLEVRRGAGYRVHAVILRYAPAADRWTLSRR